MVDITYRTTGPWGAGKGANLTPAEVDENFHSLAEAIQEALDNPTPPVEIANITLSGRQIEFVMADGSTFGPFNIPVPTFTFLENGWQPDTPMQALDLFVVPGQGLFMAEYPHTSASIFDPDTVNGSSQRVYRRIIGAVDETTYDLAFSHTAELPGDRTLLFQFVASRDLTIPADLMDSVAYLDSPLIDSDQSMDIEVDGSVVGTINFFAGDQFGSFTMLDDVDLARNSKLCIYSPAVADSAAARLSVTLTVRR